MVTLSIPPYGVQDIVRQFHLSQDIVDRLCAYENILRTWQRKINLVGGKSLDDFWRRHILDSLQILPHILPAVKTVVDLGSGAGLPGLILAVAMADDRDVDVHLIESDQRKAVFLREASRETGAGVTVHNARIEKMPGLEADVITARALAPLTDLLELSAPHRHDDTVMLFLKGENVGEELTAADKSWTMQVSEIPSLCGGSGCLLKINDVMKIKDVKRRG